MDIRSLALFRIGLSVVLFWNVTLQFSNLTAFYTDEGVLPRFALQGNGGFIDLHALSGSYLFQLILVVLTGILCLCLCLGYRTRTVTILLWLLQVSIQNRNPLIVHSGDLLLRMELFWSIFLPLGAYYSIDSLGSFFSRKSYRVFSVGTVAFLLQIFFLYFFAALLKSGPEWHQAGSAVYYALRLELYTTPFTSLLLAAPTGLLFFSTQAVWLTEFVVPWFFFFPWYKEKIRVLAVGILLLFHAGLGLFLNLGTFVFIPMIALLGLLPGYFWNHLSGLMQKYFPVSLTIYYDDDCSFCRKSVAIIYYGLLLYDVRLIPAQEEPKMEKKMQQHNSWIVADGKGKLYYKEQALARLLRSSPLFFLISPFFFWKPVVTIGDKIYEIIVKHRFLACALPKPPTKVAQQIDIWAKVLISCLVLFFLACITLWNIKSITPSFTIPRPLVDLSLLMRINEKWSMFAPSPTKDDGWYVMPAKLTNGKTVDLFTEQPITWEKPVRISAMYKDERWQIYLLNMWYRTNIEYRPFFASYLCDRWNKTHGGAERAQDVTIYFMLKEVPQPFENTDTPAVSHKLLHYPCS